MMRKSQLVLLILLSLFYVTGTVMAEDVSITGQWKGAIVIQGQELEIIVNFKEDATGLRATIDIPIQRVNNFSLGNVKLNAPDIYFELPSNAVGKFYGKIDGDKIKGEYTQASVKANFYLERVQVEEEVNKNIEEYNLHAEDGTIYGTLQLPVERDQMPVILIIAGSGPTDRDGNNPLAGSNNSLKLIAELLAENGIASVRYDKRGIAESAGVVNEQANLRFDHFISDATGYIEKLKSDPRFTKVMVLGHSQGSLVGMVAAKRAEADGFISVAGAGHAIMDVLMEQLAQLPEDVYKEAEKIARQLEKGNTVPDVAKELVNLFHPSLQPFLISWAQYDPTKEIGKLDIPVLILHGDHDIQVAIRDAELLKENSNEGILRIIQGMNHVLKDVPADPEANLASYSDPNLPLDSDFVVALVEFLTEVTE